MEATGDGSGEPAVKRRKLTQPEAPIVLEEYGDLYLHVGADHNEHPTTFLVCSKTVSRHSQVIRAMLFGGFAESQRSDDAAEPWEVDLPDDKAETLKILLGIMHGSFGQMPKKPSIAQTYEILTVADKYDCIHLIRPWSSSLIKAVKGERKDALLLGIAWHLGHTDLYMTMARVIAESSTTNDDDELLYGRSADPPLLSDVLGGSIPPSVYASITDLRTKLLGARLGPYATLYKSLLTRPRCSFNKGDRSPGGAKLRTACDDQLLGSLTKYLSSNGVTILIQKPYSLYLYDGAVAKLFDRSSVGKLRVGDTKDRVKQEDDWIGDDHQNHCRRKLDDSLSRRNRRLYQEPVELEIQPQHKAHLQRQSRKTGVDEADGKDG